MGAALQIETEIDLMVRKPGRHRFHSRACEQVGKSKDNAGKNDADHQSHLPLGKMQHCRVSTPGWACEVKRLEPSETHLSLSVAAFDFGADCASALPRTS